VSNQSNAVQPRVKGERVDSETAGRKRGRGEAQEIQEDSYMLFGK
jgi:hypothetical protein